MGAKPIANQDQKDGALRVQARPDSLRRGLLVLGTWFLTAACARAQGAPQAVTGPDSGNAATGSIHGVVTSADGTEYEGARIELSRPNDPTNATQQTDGGGAFSFVRLLPGEFKLTISSDGFQTQSISGELLAGETYDAHTIVLPVAAVANSVQVSGGSRAEIAQEQLNLEEQQRVLGIFPNYYVSYEDNAVPLTTRQKYQLAWRASIDPVTLLVAGTAAGIEQAGNAFAGYGQGAQGYAKRFGANYADGFVAKMIGGAIFLRYSGRIRGTSIRGRAALGPGRFMRSPAPSSARATTGIGSSATREFWEGLLKVESQTSTILPATAAAFRWPLRIRLSELLKARRRA